VCSKHGDYRPCRTQYGAHNYLSKEDPAPLCYGAILKPGTAVAKGQTKNKRQREEDGSLPQSKASKCANDLLSGASLQSILQQDAGYYLQNKRKIEEFASMCAVYNALKEKIPWPQEIIYKGEDRHTKEIVDWINSNIKCKRRFRQEQLFISGPKRYYKTTMVRLLKVFLMIYDIPKGEDFYDLYEDNLYDLALMDEFKGTKTLQWLNEWLQGEDMNMRQKGKQYYKKQNLPTIIMANHSLQEIYAKAGPSKLEPTESRLKIIDLLQPIDIKGFAEALGLTDHQIMKETTVVSGPINDSVNEDRDESPSSTSTDTTLPSTTRLIQIASQHKGSSRTSTPSTSKPAKITVGSKHFQRFMNERTFCYDCDKRIEHCKCAE